MAPVVKALRSRPDIFKLTLISTGQHREMLRQAFAFFSIVPDIDLDLMVTNQTLASLSQKIIERLSAHLSELRPDMLLVQGDTTTVFCGALAAFYLGIKVGHVEAGLRSHDMANPFPEEANRRLTSVLTTLHFAPTPLAREMLLREGHDPSRVIVTGNTGIDALLTLSQSLGAQRSPILQQCAPQAGQAVLVTSHRRENWGEVLENICQAVLELAEAFPQVPFLYPVHRNPRVRDVVNGMLRGKPNIHLLEPLAYIDFVLLMRDCTLILTDSGGVQEEAPTFHTPVLILREVTERPEATRLGLSKLVGTDRATIVAATTTLLTDKKALSSMQQQANPYGDGHAAERILQVLIRFFRGK